MKFLGNLIAVIGFLLFFSACKKEKRPSSVKVSSTPISILYNYEYNGTWQQKGYMLLNLNHESNKDKKFMIIDVENAAGGGYKFVIKRGPLPIDSLATNWPASVKSVSYGYSSDMVINAQMAMRVQGATPNNRFTYLYDSLHKLSNTILAYNYLNNPLYAGSMAGKAPQGRDFFWTNDANGQSKPKEVIYYFKEGYYTNTTTIGNGANPLTTLVNGIPTVTDDWKKIDAVLTLPGSYFTHFYFDFDEWRFFYTKDFCPSTWGAPCTAGLQYADYQSMNTLMTWPDGWGKK